MPDPSVMDLGRAGVERYVLRLDGCRTTPLGSYLKALGVLRLVSEQVDPDARGWWQDDTFVLESTLDEEGLKRFFLDSYQPTPILAPWNGGSGFYPKDNTTAIDAIAASGTPRLVEYRRAIDQSRDILGALGLEERPDSDAKERLLGLMRATMGDMLLPWLDAAVLLTAEGPRYPPLLGTGGNDGRLDFTNNFMAHVIAVVDPESGEAAPQASERLAGALFARPVPDLDNAAFGQFAPGLAGGPNASTGFTGDALVNSWDFIFMIEGTLLFTAAATRRLESTAGGQLSYPFTVRPTGAGSGNAALNDEGAARAETWVPVWNRPATFSEIRALLAEGRVVMGRRPAADGLDFARAVAGLGVERGISSFERYAYLMRAGRAYLATPLGGVRVRRNPEVDLIVDLDQGNWLRRFRNLARKNDAPVRLTSLVRRLEDALFALARGTFPRAAAVQEVLVVLGAVQRYLAVSRKAQEVCRPVPVIRWEWVRAANDGSEEFALAAALAGIHARRSGSEEAALPMAAHHAPLAEGRGRHRRWDPETHHRVVWGAGSLDENLGRVAVRRLLEGEALDLDDVPFHGRAGAPVAAVSSWLAGDVSETRIRDLLLGLALARIPRGLAASKMPWLPPPAAYAVLKPMFTTRRQLRGVGLLPEGVTLPDPGGITRLLVADRTADALSTARQALRSRGLTTSRIAAPPGVPGPRLLAGLLVPLDDFDLRAVLRRAFEFPDNETVPNQPAEER